MPGATDRRSTDQSSMQVKTTCDRERKLNRTFEQTPKQRGRNPGAGFGHPDRRTGITVGRGGKGTKGCEPQCATTLDFKFCSGEMKFGARKCSIKLMLISTESSRRIADYDHRSCGIKP
jgi:hypothetical protein